MFVHMLERFWKSFQSFLKLLYLLLLIAAMQMWFLIFLIRIQNTLIIDSSEIIVSRQTKESLSKTSEYSEAALSKT